MFVYVFVWFVCLYRDANKATDRDLSKEKHTDLNDLIENKDLEIQKIHKGNTVAILDKKDYILKIKNILKKNLIEKNKVLNHWINFLILKIFDEEYYQPIDRDFVGSSQVPTLVNVFLWYQKLVWIENCSLEFKPVVYRRYAYNIFLLFRSIEHLVSWIFECQHFNIKFTFQVEENNTISFLDIKVIKQNNGFSTLVRRKPKCSSAFTNFKSLTLFSLSLTY